MNEIFTVGHSNHPLDAFLSLLKVNGVEAIADVRSVPTSSFSPQFNQKALSRALSTNQIYYVYLGLELGARSRDPLDYDEQGRVEYSRLRASTRFQAGISRLIAGGQKYKIAIMCTEQDPVDCHRMVLVSRELVARGISVSHIHPDGNREGQEDAVLRLRAKFGLENASLMDSDDVQTQLAFELQESRIAFRRASEEEDDQ